MIVSIDPEPTSSEGTGVFFNDTLTHFLCSVSYRFFGQDINSVKIIIVKGGVEVGYLRMLPQLVTSSAYTCS